MPLNRLLKMNLVLLVLVLIGIIASSLAFYAGNEKFVGILGIALFALVLVLWRIFSLARNQAIASEQDYKNSDLDLDSFLRFHPPQK